MSFSTEKDLLKKAIYGDKASLEYLVLRYKDLAFTIAMKILANNEDAEEVVQDSFIKAFNKLGDFREMSKFSTWLYRIVYNTAVTKAKSRRIISVTVDEHTHITDEMQIGNSGWDTLQSKEKTKFINKTLDQLSVEDRTIIILYYIAEKSISEITDITGFKKSAIKMRLLRGRKQLYVLLEKYLQTEIKDLL